MAYPRFRRPAGSQAWAVFSGVLSPPGMFANVPRARGTYCDSGPISGGRGSARGLKEASTNFFEDTFMGGNDIFSLRDGPACGHRTKGTSGCERAMPGATQGGCCFDGARNALLPISDAAHIVHGPIGCAGTSWDSRGSRSSGAELYRTGMTTALSDLEMTMGLGEARLAKPIDQAVASFAPPAVFVYLTCVPAMVGADVDAVAEDAQRRWGIPVHCAGFYGNKNFGQQVAADALLRHVIGTREPDPIPAPARARGIATHDVNLIGEWNVGGEFWNVAPLFDELGLRILCTPSGDSCFRHVQTMHRAKVNMLVCSKALLSLAHALQDELATPFFEGSFYGVRATSAALRGFASLLRDSDLARRTQQLIEREEATVTAAIAPLRERLEGKRALIFSGGFKSWSTISAVQDLGMTVVATGIEKSTEEDKARIKELLGPEARMLDNNDQAALLRCFEEYQADILIAGHQYIYPALKARVPFLDLDHVREVGYAGYRGAIELARRIVAAVEHPVWAETSRPVPWDIGLPRTQRSAA
jgi:nitrogenase molybdenum-iron cofactor biosynthesis protein NifE